MSLMSTVKFQAIASIVKLLFKMLPVEKVRTFLENGLDGLEEYSAKETTSSILSIATAGLCRIIRDFLKMPDDDLVGSEHDKLMDFIDSIFETLDVSAVNAFIDAGLDGIEDMVEESKNKWDDIIILPLCSLVRQVAGVEDND